MSALRGAVLALAVAGCVSTQRPAPHGVASPMGELTLRLDPDEDPAHALSVATRRLGDAGLTRAEVTAVTGSLSVRLPTADHARARAVLVATPWLRGRYVDARLDLRPLGEAPPSGIRVTGESVALMPGFDVVETTVESDSREALLAHIASFPSLAANVVPVQTVGGAWRARALLPRVMARGGEITACRVGASGAEVILERSPSARAPSPRRWVVELNGVYRGTASDEAGATIQLRSRAEVEAFIAQCALGLLGGPITPDDQRPNQGTGSSVAP